MEQSIETTAADTTQAATETAATDVTTEVKAEVPADAAATETKPEVKAEEPKTPERVAPEAYEDFTSPDGVEIDTEVLGQLKALGKELNLDQASAQKVFDLGVQLQQRQAQAWEAQMQKWIGEVRSDKEIGGDKLPENLALAKKAVEQFGGKEFSEFLDSSGMGSHPAFIRAFHRIGKAISEDTFVSGNKNAGTTNSLENTLYGKR